MSDVCKQRLDTKNQPHTVTFSSTYKEPPPNQDLIRSSCYVARALTIWLQYHQVPHTHMWRWFLHFWTTEMVLLERDLFTAALMKLQLCILLMTVFSAKCFLFLMMWGCMKLFPHQCTHSPKHFYKALSLKVLRQQLSHLYTSTSNSN